MAVNIFSPKCNANVILLQKKNKYLNSKTQCRRDIMKT